MLTQNFRKLETLINDLESQGRFEELRATKQRIKELVQAPQRTIYAEPEEGQHTAVYTLYTIIDELPLFSGNTHEMSEFMNTSVDTIQSCKDNRILDFEGQVCELVRVYTTARKTYNRFYQDELEKRTSNILENITTATRGIKDTHSNWKLRYSNYLLFENQGGQL